MSTKQRILIYITLMILMLPAFLNILISFYGEVSGCRSKLQKSLPEFPETLKQLELYPMKIDNYIIATFPGRRELIQEISEQLKHYNMSLSSKVIFGKNDMLFYKGEANVIDKHRAIRVLSYRQLDEWSKSYIDRKQIVESYGGKLYFIIVPDKHSMYPENLPEYLTVIDRPRIAEQLEIMFNENKVEGFLYLQDCLRKHIIDTKLYFNYDTHWTDQGGYIGYLEVMRMIDPQCELNWISQDQFNYKSVQQKGDLAGMLCIPEMVEDALEADFDSILPEVISDKETVNYWNTEYVCEAKGQAKTALFICDSFLESVLGKYLERTFGKSIYIRHSAHKDMELIKKYRPDIVVYCYVERLVPNRLSYLQ